MSLNFQTSETQSYPVSARFISHALGFGNMDSKGGGERFGFALKHFLDPENQDWNDAIQSGGSGYFDKGELWKEHVGISQNLRIMTACLCSGRTGYFMDTGGMVNKEIKNEIQAILSQLNATEREVFMKHIWPVIKSQLVNWDSHNHGLLHSFNVYIVEDSEAEIRKIVGLVDKILGIRIPEVFVNRSAFERHISDIRVKNFDTDIFFLDGAVPEDRGTPGTVSTTQVIPSIREKFPQGVIISNTTDNDLRDEHEAAGVDYFAHKDVELHGFLLRELLFKRLTN